MVVFHVCPRNERKDLQILLSKIGNLICHGRKKKSSKFLAFFEAIQYNIMRSGWHLSTLEEISSNLHIPRTYKVNLALTKYLSRKKPLLLQNIWILPNDFCQILLLDVVSCTQYFGKVNLPPGVCFKDSVCTAEPYRGYQLGFPKWKICIWWQMVLYLMLCHCISKRTPCKGRVLVALSCITALWDPVINSEV